MKDVLERIPDWAENTAATALVIIISVTLGLCIHKLIWKIVRRFARGSRNRIDDIVILRLNRPVRWSLIVLIIAVAVPITPFGRISAPILSQVAGFVVPLLFGWLALGLLNVLRDAIEARADITASNNLAARRQRTRAGILTRIGSFLIIFLTICMMLLSIPGVRSIGVTLMASAGLAGLAVGAAAQPALKNLIAGIQMAFSEPIRIDDVVIIEGEWGRIEEIRLTYVVVRIWDDRRLIVPVSKFLEDAFQNWTRQSSALLGTAFLYVDPTANVAKLRTQLRSIVEANENWDGRVVGLQVTDVTPDVMELRALVSAADAGSAFDLRCEVREAMMAYLGQEAVSSLPRRRNEIVGRPGEWSEMQGATTRYGSSQS
ncbi:mechanosensitive ion channel family protein [Sphingobium sp. BS19]|uniref:mechanosensitive ion channel family protein n=1 Tax=Sphingobium sp. BS19 TaxID=3018973 RepID=UPI002492A7F5|nr:mechanosensitive ion channel domain-containing protein [Sphingobium sp. BS19]